MKFHVHHSDWSAHLIMRFGMIWMHERSFQSWKSPSLIWVWVSYLNFKLVNFAQNFVRKIKLFKIWISENFSNSWWLKKILDSLESNNIPTVNMPIASSLSSGSPILDQTMNSWTRFPLWSQSWFSEQNYFCNLQVGCSDHIDLVSSFAFW